MNRRATINREVYEIVNQVEPIEDIIIKRDSMVLNILTLTESYIKNGIFTGDATDPLNAIRVIANQRTPHIIRKSIPVLEDTLQGLQAIN